MTRNSTSVTRRVAGRAAGATLGFIVGDVPGAVAGYKLMKNSEKSFPQMPAITPRVSKKGRALPPNELKTERQKMKNAFRKVFGPSLRRGTIADQNFNSRIGLIRARGGRSVGTYKGKFKKAKKLKKDGLKTKAQKNGYHITGEIHGVVQDPHCIYIGHGTFHAVNFAKVLFMSAMRNLFKKAGLVPATKNSKLQLEPGGTSFIGQLRFVWQFMHPVTGVVTAYTRDWGAGDTFEGFVEGWTAVQTPLNQMFLNDLELLPHKLYMYRCDLIDTMTDEAQYHEVCHLDLDSQVFTIWMKSTLAVQNRTAGDLATSGDLSLDRVDSQPLKGKKYFFKGGSPRLRNVMDTLHDTTDAQLNNTTYYTFRSIRSGQLTGDHWEPPNPKMFSNCTKATNISLQPGDIKSTTISHKWSGSINTLVKKLSSVSLDGDYISSVPGKYEMICVEEVIRTAGTNPITLNYEREYEIGGWCTNGRKKPVWITDFESSTVNNVP